MLRIRTLLLSGLLLILSMSACLGDDFNLENYKTTIGEDAVLLSANFDFNLPGSVRDALDQGVDIIFVIAVEVAETRSLQPDNRIVDIDIRKRLGYHTLAKKYTVDDLTFGQSNSYHALETALKEVGRLYQIHLIDTSVARAHPDALVRLRINLSLSDLPFPLRLQALVQPAWHITSPWFAWKIN